MSAVEPLDVAEPAALEPAGFDLRRAAAPGVPPPTPVIFASPHSGRLYPEDMMSAARLDAQAIRRSEDAFVDQLVDGAPQAGAALITANYARAYIDVNRDAFELDPAMFADELPDFARSRTARVAAGLGAIAKVVSEGQEIYARKLTFAEAQGRIDGAHRPYHAALTQLIAEAQAAHGVAILVDWHSMPSIAAKAAGVGSCDMVLGDRFGAACSNTLTRLAEVELEARGYRVVRNTPYAGGYTTEHYGRPARRVHYLDEDTLSPTPGFARLKADIAALTLALTAHDWADRL